MLVLLFNNALDAFEQLFDGRQRVESNDKSFTTGPSDLTQTFCKLATCPMRANASHKIRAHFESNTYDHDVTEPNECLNMSSRVRQNVRGV